MRRLSTNIDLQNANNKNDRSQKMHSNQAQNNTLFLLPLFLFVSVVLVDQASKYLIVMNIGEGSRYGEIIRLFDGFIWIVKVYNKGIAFSLASNSVSLLRLLIVYLIPLVLVFYLLKIVVYSYYDTQYRWYAALVAGGGVGNLIDRIFREEGVVDFISVNTYNIFNISRWPTFNFADMAVIAGMFLWLLGVFLAHNKQRERRMSTNVRENYFESKGALHV